MGERGLVAWRELSRQHAGQGAQPARPMLQQARSKTQQREAQHKAKAKQEQRNTNTGAMQKKSKAKAEQSRSKASKYLVEGKKGQTSFVSK